MSLTNFPLLTFLDATDHVLDQVLGGDASLRNRRQAVRAVQEAYEELPQRRAWRYYYRPFTIHTVASQSSSTITYCVTPEHEALTRDGWKRRGDLRVGDEIMSYDHLSGLMRWSPIQKLHDFHHSGRTLEAVIRGRRIMQCTPDHRIPVLRETVVGGVRQRRKAWTTAAEMLENDTVPTIADYDHGDWVGCGLGVRLSSILGWAVTDGSGLLDFCVGENGHTVLIMQSPTANPEHCDEIAALTGSVGVMYGQSTCNTYRVFARDKKAIRSVIKSRKDLPSLVAKMSPEEAAAFKSACEKADGHRRSNGEQTLAQWNQKNKPVAEAYQIACILVGKGANLRTSEYRGKLRHTVETRKTKSTCLNSASKWTHYEGPVWCPEVESGAWLVRCNGHISITGNSASTRSVTLASGTWPTEAIKYAIYISGARYTVATRSSSTVLILDEKDAPTADIAAGTSYVLSRDTYELPDNLRRVISLEDVNAPSRPMPCVSPADVLYEQRRQRGAAQPLMYGVYRSELYASSYAIHFAPSPSTARVYQGYGMFYPQPIKVLDYNTGTVSTTSSSTALVGVGTTFTSDHVGAVMRISPTGSLKLPTDIQGEIDKNRLEPFAMQRVIRSRTDALNLVFEQEADATLATSGYRISSRIDIQPGAMRNAFLRCCEAKFATQDRRGSEQREARYERALAMAMQADQRIDDTSPSGFSANSLADVASSISLTTGGTQP